MVPIFPQDHAALPLPARRVLELFSPPLIEKLNSTAGACCNGQTGLCGFGAAFCSAPHCTSNCASAAECGPNGATGQATCPLCDCSKDGFCGTSADYCGTGCLSECGSVAIPSCSVTEATAMKRRIGYYEGWAASRGCMAYPPEQIAADTLTHINYASAVIDSSFKIIQMSSGDTALWSRTSALKTSRPGLKVFLSIGGWTFNNPRTSHIFSNLVASAANTNTFIASALTILETYSFDGIDIDWNYPGSADRGGVHADTANYVSCSGEFRTEVGQSTAPMSYWYLQHFDLPAMLAHADWVNVMTYDLHGTCGLLSKFSTTELTKIDAGLQLFWRAGVDPSQVVMGM
ncbi:glycoside hydrolase superfamily [Mycena epipterygia]|nr:glycoside hydrolase superfamily [Mycena epipterygia]